MVTRTSRNRQVLGVLVLFLLGNLTGCKWKDLVCVGKAEEIQIGMKFTMAVLAEEGGEVNDPEMQKQITRIGKNIASKCDRKDLPWQFYYVNNETHNAGALPGGRIFINKGLVTLLKGDDGKVDVDMLAGIIGHEVGHCVARHGVRSMEDDRWADVGQGVINVMTKPNITKDEMMATYRKSTMLGFSRDFERQADKLGAIYAARAGYAKDGLMRAMKHFEELELRYPSGKPSYERTHPHAKDRVATLEKQLPMLDDETIAKVAYKVDDSCKGWWGVLNIAVDLLKIQYALKTADQLRVVDTNGDGIGDTVVYLGADGKKAWYKVAGKGDRGLWQVATRTDKKGNPVYDGYRGYSPTMAQAAKAKAKQLLAAGKTKEAIAELNRALAFGDNAADTRLQLAKAYEKTGNTVAAEKERLAVLRTEWDDKAIADATMVTSGNEEKQPQDVVKGGNTETVYLSKSSSPMLKVTYVKGKTGVVFFWNVSTNSLRPENLYLNSILSQKPFIVKGQPSSFVPIITPEVVKQYGKETSDMICLLSPGTYTIEHKKSENNLGGLGNFANGFVTPISVNVRKGYTTQVTLPVTQVAVKWNGCDNINLNSETMVALYQRGATNLDGHDEMASRPLAYFEIASGKELNYTIPPGEYDLRVFWQSFSPGHSGYKDYAHTTSSAVPVQVISGHITHIIPPVGQLSIEWPGTKYGVDDHILLFKDGKDWGQFPKFHSHDGDETKFKRRITIDLPPGDFTVYTFLPGASEIEEPGAQSGYIHRGQAATSKITIKRGQVTNFEPPCGTLTIHKPVYDAWALYNHAGKLVASSSLENAINRIDVYPGNYTLKIGTGLNVHGDVIGEKIIEMPVSVANKQEVHVQKP